MPKELRCSRVDRGVCMGWMVWPASASRRAGGADVAAGREHRPGEPSGNPRGRRADQGSGGCGGRAKAGYYPTFGARSTYENKPRPATRMGEQNFYKTTGEVDWLLTDFGVARGRSAGKRTPLKPAVPLVNLDGGGVFMVPRAFFDYLRARAWSVSRRIRSRTAKPWCVRPRALRCRDASQDRRGACGGQPFAAKAASSRPRTVSGSRGPGSRTPWPEPLEERPVAAEVHARPPTLSLEEAVKAAFESRTEIRSSSPASTPS